MERGEQVPDDVVVSIIADKCASPPRPDPPRLLPAPPLFRPHLRQDLTKSPLRAPAPGLDSPHPTSAPRTTTSAPALGCPRTSSESSPMPGRTHIRSAALTGLTPRTAAPGRASQQPTRTGKRRRRSDLRWDTTTGLLPPPLYRQPPPANTTHTTTSSGSNLNILPAYTLNVH